jgi:hypothetical protein
MKKISDTKAISRRKALALMGLGAALGLLAASVPVSDAEAHRHGATPGAARGPAGEASRPLPHGAPSST